METNTQTVSSGDALETIETTETTETPTPYQTVSGGDANDGALSSELLFHAESQTDILEEINERHEAQTQTIWEKPIEEYTPTEGILLIIMFCVVGVIIFKFIGGIISCNK